MSAHRSGAWCAAACAAIAILSIASADAEGDLGGAEADIIHSPAACAPRGQSPVIEASVSEPPRVTSVDLWYMPPYESAWTRQPMARTAGDLWRAELPARLAVEKHLDYWIDAVDATGRHSRSPEGAGGYRILFGTEFAGSCSDDFYLLSCGVGVFLTVVLVAVALVLRRARANR